MRKWVADFETTVPKIQIPEVGEEEYFEPEYDFDPSTRVWAWGVRELWNPGSFIYGNDINEFMEWCSKQKGNPVIYFHNLKFDGEFIFYWLLTNGFTYDKKKNTKTFNCIISDMGQFYSIEIIYKRMNKRYQKVTFYDSLKKLPFPVKTIGKAFKLPVQKGEIDYKKERPPGYEPDDEEIDYLENDLEVVAQALEIQFDQGLDRMTNGSDALHWFKELIGKRFEKLFPVLPLNVDEEIRYAYKGGFTYADPRFRGKNIDHGSVYDVVSLYPSVMYDQPLPYGVPVPFEGEYEYDKFYPLYIQKIYCEFKLKPGKIPTIQIKHHPGYKATEYVEETKYGPVSLVLTSVDIELFFEHYDVTVHEYINGYKFKQCIGVFRQYINYWLKIKKENKGAIRQLAKLMLNSLYGKFASNPDVTGKIPEIDEETGGVKYVKGPEENKDPVYTAMGCFITAWARYKTINAAQENYDRFIYADTDSLHLIGTEPPKGLDVGFDLGEWEPEGYFMRARFLRAKTYIEYMCYKLDEKGDKISVLPEECHWVELKVTCAGMPDKVKAKVTWQNFKEGFSEKGKNVPRHVPGGIVLVDSEFTIH